MKTEFLAKFSKDIDAIQSKAVKQKIIAVITQIEEASTLQDVRGLKKLRGIDHAYRIRIGEYRIGVFIEHSTVQFARVLHRRDIYQVFP
jgi:mRNA interferase RelE/StbE